MSEIIFQVTPCVETGGYVARWDSPRDGGYFEPKQRPKRIRLHFSQDPILAVA